MAKGFVRLKIGEGVGAEVEMLARIVSFLQAGGCDGDTEVNTLEIFFNDQRNKTEDVPRLSMKRIGILPQCIKGFVYLISGVEATITNGEKVNLKKPESCANKIIDLQVL